MSTGYMPKQPINKVSSMLWTGKRRENSELTMYILVVSDLTNTLFKNNRCLTKITIKYSWHQETHFE